MTNDQDRSDTTPITSDGVQYKQPWKTRARLWWSERTRGQRVVTVMLGLVVVGALALIAPARWWYSCGRSVCPTLAELQRWRPSEGGRVIDRSGNLLAPLVATRRQNISLDDVPPHVRAAFIAVEDKRFLKHHGADYRGIARALVNNLKSGGVREGASTITMQLARNVFLSDRLNDRTLGRKLLEWRYANLLEKALTKDEILERYLNAIYLGNGVYGVEGASQDLFGKSVRDLDAAEAALLAGLPKAPSVYSPRKSVARARERRDVALGVMLREHVIDKATYDASIAKAVPKPGAEWRPNRPDASWASEFARSVIDSLRKTREIDPELQDGELVVYTTVDTRAQNAAEAAVESGVRQLDRARSSYSNVRRDPTQGALVALDPQDGAILAIVGGRGDDVRGFDRAVRAQRQPGSAFKPFVYAAAVQQGFTAASMVDDEPVEIQTSGQRMWRPANYDGRYYGRITMRDALARSANAAAVRVSQDVGLSRIVEVAQRMGIRSELPQVPALALGAGGVTPLELTAAYAAFDNGGMRVTPHMVLRIDDVFGRTVYTAGAAPRAQALTAPDAFIVTSMLRSVVDHGTGNGVRAAGLDGPIAGKTGTTNDGADVWFVGFTPSIVAAVWFGTDKPQPLGSGASGGRFAAPVWASFIAKGWHSPAQDAEWVPPGGVVEREIDIGTGMRSDPLCGPARREWFKPGTEPIASCTESISYAAMIDSLFTDSIGGALVDTMIDTNSVSRRLRDSVMVESRKLRDSASSMRRMLDSAVAHGLNPDTIEKSLRALLRQLRRNE